MKRLLPLLFGLSLLPSARASTIIDFPLSEPSGKLFTEILFPDSGGFGDGACSIHANRPDRDEPASASPENSIRCSWKDGAESRTYSFADSPTEYWGALESRDIEIHGPFTEKLLALFRDFTKDLPDVDVDGSMWSRIFLCDPNADTCLQSYFLNAYPNRDSAAQIACSRETELIPGHSGTIDVDPADFPTYSAYLNAIVERQIARGERRVRDENCVFLAP